MIIVWSSLEASVLVFPNISVPKFFEVDTAEKWDMADVKIVK